MEMVILIGLQASGKSTFRRARFGDSHVVVSKDDFRSNARPARRQEYLLRAALRAGNPVVVDNTNVRLADRALLIQLARDFGVPSIGYYLCSTVEDSLRWNAQRDGKFRVPDIGVFATAKVFTPPTWSEGFAELYRMTHDAAGSFVVCAVPKEGA
jgi:predicted kinase